MLGLATQRDEPPAAALHAFLGGRRTLLLLDNFEVVDAAAPLVSELLRAAPGLVVLATSRAPLRLSGEHQYRVGPLPLAGCGPAVRRRAPARSRPASAGPGEEADEVTRLCRRLDCLPLAIELAAARTRDYAPAELLESVSGSLELAVEGARDLPSRQRTLRSTIDWSYRLLAADGAGDRSRASPCSPAASATRAPPRSAAPTGRTLASLVGASLVHERVDAGGAMRWFMLETVREYALELLDAAGEGEECRRRHAEHYAELAEAIEDEHPASGSGAAWQRLEAEQDNFRAALDWSRGRHRAGAPARGRARVLLGDERPSARGARAARRRAARTPRRRPPPLRAKALAGAALVAHSLGDYERMRDAAEASLELFRALGDERRTALALNQLGIALSNLGDIDGGIVCHEENAAISRRLGDGMRLSAALNNLGYCLLRRRPLRPRPRAVRGGPGRVQTRSATAPANR